MPQIVLGPPVAEVDGSAQKAVYAFLSKLQKDDTTPGLHIEPINNCIDPRVRTGRVNDFYRAVLVKVQGSGAEAHYIYFGTLPHDDAIAMARKVRLSVNPRNGIAELIRADADSQAGETPAVPEQPVVAEPPSSGEKTLRQREFTVADFSNLGIDAAFAEGALDIADPSVLLDYAGTAPAKWQGEALLDIYTGKPLSEVREAYAISETSTDAESDDDLLVALKHPAAQMEFAFINGDDDSLRDILEKNDFHAWRVYLHPEQRAYVEKHYNGSARLSGGAGTGKTVVLLHRARALARANPSARIILTTFNRTLADALEDQLKVLDRDVKIASDLGQPGIYIGGIDAIGHRILTTAGHALGASAQDSGPVAAVLGPRGANILGLVEDGAWANAAAGSSLPSELRSPGFLSSEYSLVVLPNGITTREGYLRVRRPGRGVALDRPKRSMVWDVFEAYRSAAAASGASDWDERAMVAAKYLDMSGKRLADHVLVDEAQDLSPTRLVLLRALVRPGPNDVFLAEDSNQRIYGNQIVLSRFGFDIRGRSRRLTLNYRTTEENLRYALGILSGEQYVDLGDEPVVNAGYRSARSGPKPLVIRCDSLGDVYAKAAQLLLEWGDSVGPIGLLVSTRKDGENLPRRLAEHGAEARFVDRDGQAVAGKPTVMTMHRSKGMEFSRVILLGVSKDGIPSEYRMSLLPEAERAEVLRRERSLLYVAATRARDVLAVLYSGEPSDLLPAI
ncbi:UvrD-helicase domain-containing protein [Smaragdicoccus niigatensis]|uniref:UvrD-helicase domain-containing protein n=1 Tax=Smaragdicoccus niigatensis TaxID=359359 RepID=UPI000368F7E0|nr:UvrD-helicase domain-containing protein [Smaragdicoccus niigatensis]